MRVPQGINRCEEMLSVGGASSGLEGMTSHRQEPIVMIRNNKRFPMIWFAAATGLFTIWFIGLAVSQDRRASTDGDGSYMPLSVGNWWVYRFGSDSHLAGKTQKWKVDDKWIDKGDAIYILSSIPSLGNDAPLDLSSLAGRIVEGDGRFLLKYPVHTGNRWSSKSQGYGVEGKLNEFEVVFAGKTCSVGNRSFDDCATIREIDESIKLFSLTTYARGVGPVKYVYFKDLNFKQVERTLTIESWKLH
jgi:hypothetical protein